jgi:BirA family biotin operon repressor/biotin-[acetyl-CoA-carboxylase] ligase
MQHVGMDLPQGYRLAAYDAIDSTNTEGLRLAAKGEDSGLWIWAAEQRQGRGRSGRNWTSPPGNLHASLLLRPHVPLVTAQQLSLLAGVAAHDAILSLASSAAARLDVRLKWPNDILCGNAKLGGILLESTSTVSVTGRDGNAPPPIVVIGSGLNIAHAPQDLGRPATCLHELGIRVTPAQALAALAWTTAEWLARWNEGLGFELIRQAWQERAQTVGETVSVHIGGKRLIGTFLGLDAAGALRLATSEGGERSITAGEVSLMTSEA